MMSRSKKRFAWVLMLVLALLVSACGKNASDTATGGGQGKKEGGNESASGTKKPVEMRLLVNNDWGKSEGLAEIIKKYEAETGNKITIDMVPPEQALNIITTKISTGDAPDLIMTNAGSQYIPYNFLEPLSGPWTNLMEPSVKKVISENDKVYQAYAAPIGYYGAIYNKEVLEKAGVKLPLMNYRQLVDALKAIQATGVEPIVIPGKDSWTHEMIPALGGVHVMQKDPSLAQKIRTNQTKASQEPAFIELAERVLALKPYTNKDALSLPYGDAAWKKVLEGKSGMVMVGDWLYTDFERIGGDAVNNVSMMPFTLSNDYISGVVGLTLRAFAIPRNSPHKETAQQFINYVMTAENFAISVKPFKGASPYKGFPTKKSAWQIDYEKKLADNQIPVTNSYLNEFLTGFQYGDSGVLWQSMFSGKDIKAAYDDWYKEYEKLNRVAKTPGF
ncbi:extracellular solute-binding protein [Paenibacillus hemerocallicola]|uniref:Extracellular solute-binding protein n=1 Tax=Paenibacillus hemerocallicola TaxID=1172614 RepID=A0A5C4TEU9_9BACL|nr:extracellular solute-binding protein [Paenibacillus hemerocallicola]TNJ66959.1 extracellular solute-binding protein [Paenibacillus hemerocallicola]